MAKLSAGVVSDLVSLDMDMVEDVFVSVDLNTTSGTVEVVNVYRNQQV